MAGFVYLHTVDPSIGCDIKYATTDNLIGRPIAGYEANTCIVSEKMAHVLHAVQKTLQPQGLSLVVYEAYRPLKASEDLLWWSLDAQDQKNKATHYPKVEKSRLYTEHYILLRSRHNRGAAVDVTLIDKKTGIPLDMGTPFDYMDELSHPANTDVGPTIYERRQNFRALMENYGFMGIQSEW